MDFPEFISLSITNACNLRCRMCGQWSEEGYIHNGVKSSGSQMKLADWKRVIDEVAEYKIRFVLIRGGEPFLYPGIIELLQYISSKGLSISVDTNGTELEKYAAELVRIGPMHITFSVDGPEEIHDNVRNVKGTFKKLKENIALLLELEKANEKKISKSACFTISPYSYKGLGVMPDVIRSLGLTFINIVPYYYFSSDAGKKYEEEFEKHFNCPAFSWKGFHHEESGIEFETFREEYRKYLANLNGIYDFPFLPLNEEEYRIWFKDCTTPVGLSGCRMVDELIDIQPDGNANFCIDFPDYSFGNVKESRIIDIWNSPKAEQFRKYRHEKPLPVCHRCGAKYITEIKG